MQKALIALAIAVGFSSMAWALEVGDPAPPLEVRGWIAEKPLTIAEAKGKKLVIVEWWATWDADSRKMIPRLNRLQRLHGEKLDIVAVTDEDEGAVKKVLATTPIRYRLALDKGVASKKVWMQYITTTPYAFIVGLDGKIAWHGSPERGLYPAVADLLADRFDSTRFVKLNATYTELTHSLKAGKIDEVLRFLDQMIATVPEDAWAHGLKLSIYRKQRRSAEAREACIAMGKACAGDPDALAEAAQRLATAGGLPLRDMPLALGLAKQAADLTKGQEPGILATLARCHYELGHLTQAALTQALAVKAAGEADQPALIPALRFYAHEQQRRAKDPDAK